MGRSAQRPGGQPIDLSPVVESIDRDLTDLARQVIRRYLDTTDDANRRFLADPDGRDQHQTKWHQWGIITHTRVFLHLYNTAVPKLLAEWGLRRQVDAALAHEVDGVPRRDLLRLAILLHDIGKFGARTQGRQSFHFSGHEVLSGKIIRDDLRLERYGLTPAQIRYVATTAEDHFVLALLRKRAREAGSFDFDFVASDAFICAARQIQAHHPDDYVEVGVLYLGDSLAKAEPGRGPEPALSQHEINIALARRYLALVLAGGSLQ